MVSLFYTILIIHRIGTIIALSSALVLPFIPKIFAQPGDERFRNQAHTVVLWITRIGLTVLAFSGIWRLTYGVPVLFPLKAVFIVVDFALYIHPPVDLDDPRYTTISLIMALLLYATATVGLFL
jgi:hypothetical protein